MSPFYQLSYSAVAKCAVAIDCRDEALSEQKKEVRLALLHGSGAATILISGISGVMPAKLVRGVASNNRVGQKITYISF